MGPLRRPRPREEVAEPDDVSRYSRRHADARPRRYESDEEGPPGRRHSGLSPTKEAQRCCTSDSTSAASVSIGTLSPPPASVLTPAPARRIATGSPTSPIASPPKS